MRRRAPCNPRAVHICRYVIKYFPTIWYLYCGHCCICIQSRCMHISPVSKLTSPLPPRAPLAAFPSARQIPPIFFLLPLSNKFAKYPRLDTISRFSIHRKYFRKILLARWEKITQISDFPNYFIRFTSVAIPLPSYMIAKRLFKFLLLYRSISTKRTKYFIHIFSFKSLVLKH